MNLTRTATASPNIIRVKYLVIKREWIFAVAETELSDTTSLLHASKA
jgi:hypothetical protein